MRETIKQRMKSLGIKSAYALTKLIEHKISRETVGNYLTGRTEMTAANLELILNALGAEEIVFTTKSTKEHEE